MATGFMLWGLLQGPLTEAAIVGTGAAEQILDGSGAPRTVSQRVKALVLTNIQGAADNIYVGGSTVSGAAFVLEIKPGDPPAVIEVQPQGAVNFWFNCPATTTLYAAQVG